jgi:hypothetical protein
MRSPLGKECRKLFRKMMAVEFSDYKEDKTQVVPHGWYVWTHQPSASLFFHIVLVIDNSRDKFTTEGGWDFDGKLLPCLCETRDILSRPSRVRTTELWSSKDFWWPLVLRPEEYDRSTFRYKDDPIEQCLPLVAPAVWEAGEKLKEYAIPVFKEVVQKHGSVQTR